MAVVLIRSSFFGDGIDSGLFGVDFTSSLLWVALGSGFATEVLDSDLIREDLVSDLTGVAAGFTSYDLASRTEAGVFFGVKSVVLAEITFFGVYLLAFFFGDASLFTLLLLLLGLLAIAFFRLFLIVI